MDCIKLCRAVPLGIPHSTQQEAQLCCYTIPCDTVVICNHQAVHLNETSWNNPCEFDPERFLDEDCEQPRLLRCISNFLPFGLGGYFPRLVSLSVSVSLIIVAGFVNLLQGRMSIQGCSSPNEDHHNSVASAIQKPPSDWKRPEGRPSHTYVQLRRI